MGFPDLFELYSEKNRRKKAILMAVYVAGVVGFFKGCKMSNALKFSNQLF